MNKLALITAVIVSTFALNSFAADAVVSTENSKIAQKETKEVHKDHKESHHKKHKKEEAKKDVVLTTKKFDK